MIFPLMAAEFGNKPSPEDRAALRYKLIQVADLIPDKALRAEYRTTLLDHFYIHFRAFRKNQKKEIPFRVSSSASVASTQVLLDQTYERQRLLLCLLLKYPRLIPHVEEAFCTLDLPYPFDEMRSLLLDFSAEASVSEDLILQNWLTDRHAENIIQAVMQEKKETIDMFLQNDDQEGLEKASMQWWHVYGLLNRDRFEYEVARLADRLFSKDMWDAEEWKRLQSLLEMREQLRAGDIDESVTNASFLLNSKSDCGGK